jgi:hypothetical protein
MSLNDELNQIASDAAKSDDVSQLSDYQKRCEVILANVTTTLAAEQDEELRSHLTEVKETAESTLHEVKQRLADVKVARLDPQYEQRKAQKQREAELKKQQDQERAQQFLAQGGLGKVFGGMFGGLAGAGAAQPGGPATGAGPGSTVVQPASSASAAPAGIPAATKCGQCGAEIKAGVKFCGECGTPVPHERHCTNCGAKLAAEVKFCGECGTRQP